MGDIERDERGNTYVRVEEDTLSLIQKIIGKNVFKEVYTTNFLRLDDESKNKKYGNSCWIKVSENERNKLANV